MELTKQQAIQEHRKMWNWIADQYKTGQKLNIRVLKKYYIYTVYPGEYVLNDCFCCEYERVEDCSRCLLIWGEAEGATCEYSDSWEYMNGYKMTGIYAKLRKLTFEKDFDNLEAERLARAIAILPERED